MLRLDAAFMPDDLSKRTREKLSWQMENDTALSKDFAATLLGRFREVHQRLASSADIYSSEIGAILSSVESAFGYLPDSSYRTWFEWYKAHRDIGAFLCDVGGTFEPFVERIREDMTFEVRRQIERLFLHLAGRHEVPGWFEDLLREEGFYPDEATTNEFVSAH